MESVAIAFTVIALAALAIALFFIGRKVGRESSSLSDEQQQSLDSAVRIQVQLEECQKRTDQLASDLENERSRTVELSKQNSSLTADLENERQKIEQMTAQRDKEVERLTKEFENLANRVLHESSKKVTAIQEEKLGSILKPVGQKLEDFHKSVISLKEQGITHQTEFREQLKNLKETSSSMNEEARNLTRALEGQKSQGMWGEFILEKVLESSGLQKGEEYRVQESHTGDDSTRKQPDVIVYLPEDKHLIIDAKVSLTAYLRLTESQRAEERKAALKEHLLSIRSHIDNLAGKEYDSIEGLSSPEIVLLFVPIEPAFVEALRNDAALFDYAFNKKIVLVTPTTLLATLKTVASLWRQEKQNRNALEIARLGGELYDKFVGFTTDLDEVGKRLRQASDAHESASAKLSTGRGNAVRTIERMKDLGLKTKKELDPDRVEQALEGK
ncbi:MAG: DNA recombination protein RmuC [Verrucomicrobiota bacterium]